jgi:hypothetical protein
MKIWILIALSLGFTIASAKADFSPFPAPIAKNTKLENLLTLITQQCKLPELQPYSANLLKNYVKQAVDPQQKMLNTTFAKGFSPLNSEQNPLSFCVVVFMGFPNDSYWEPTAEFYVWAKHSGTLPELMFNGFEMDSVRIKALPEGGVN